MNTYDFSGKCVVVTGGANGIGAAVAERALSSGARVAIWDLAPDRAEDRIARHAGPDVLFFQVDVSDPASVDGALHQTEAKFGNVDILVNSAGIAGPTHTIAEYPVDAWKEVQDINLTGTFLCCRSVVPGMIAQGYGRIVNIASIAGKEGNPNAGAYSASKAGVIALTKSLGKELAAHDIAVNTVTPATAQTRLLEQVSDEFIDYMRSKIPRGRFVAVEEIASMVCWLASAENSFTTAAVFDLSGGRATY